MVLELEWLLKMVVRSLIAVERKAVKDLALNCDLVLLSGNKE